MTFVSHNVSLRRALAALCLMSVLPASSVRAAETYAYDAQSRLTDASYSDGSSLHYTYDANGNLLSVVSSGGTTAVDPRVPESFQFALGSLTPNPGSGQRSINFSIAAAGHVRLSVTDVAGRAVATLYDRDLAPGRYAASFSSARWATGVYFFRLESAGRSLHGRLIVAR
ncbi:MAG: T9SS type A sorting domain-containing protein [Candidatus Eiseniibacteriota bacterium]